MSGHMALDGINVLDLSESVGGFETFMVCRIPFATGCEDIISASESGGDLNRDRPPSHVGARQMGVARRWPTYPLARSGRGHQRGGVACRQTLGRESKVLSEVARSEAGKLWPDTGRVVRQLMWVKKQGHPTLRRLTSGRRADSIEWYTWNGMGYDN